MWFTLAEALGMSVARCRAEVSSAEFVQWCGFYRRRREEIEKNRASR